MSRILDLGDYCVNTKYILSVSKGEFSPNKNNTEYYLYVKFRYNNDRLARTYSNKQKRDSDYKKIFDEWKHNTDRYGD